MKFNCPLFGGQTTPLNKNERAGIISFNIVGKNPEVIYENLLRDGIVSKIRNKAIRISPDSNIDIDIFCNSLENCIERSL